MKIGVITPLNKDLRAGFEHMVELGFDNCQLVCWDLSLYTGVAEVYEADAEGKGWSDCRTCYNTPPYDRYIDMIRSFAAMVKGEIENPYSYEYEVTLHRAILAACGVEADYKASVIL